MSHTHTHTHTHKYRASLVTQGKRICMQCRTLGFNAWVGRSPEEWNGNPPQYSCLENSTDRGAWWATVHGVDKSGTQLSNEHLHTFFFTSMAVGLVKTIAYLAAFSLNSFQDGLRAAVYRGILPPWQLAYSQGLNPFRKCEPNGHITPLLGLLVPLKQLGKDR